MRHFLLAAVLALVIPCAASAAIAAPMTSTGLDIGARLPALSDVAWLGEAVDPSGAFTVVDLWSPDNPACRATMPRLTDLQRHYPGVRVIGLAAGDRDRIAGFVTGMGARVGYAIGVVPSLAPFAPSVGAPCTLLLDRSGTLLWWGDAMDAMQPLARALNGTFVPEPIPPAVLEAPCAEAMPQVRERETRVVEVRRAEPRVVIVDRPWCWSVDVCGSPCRSHYWVPRPPLVLFAPLPPLFGFRHCR